MEQEQQSEQLSWQVLLGQFIERPSERKRLAAAVKVSPVTLQRWANRISRPRYENALALVQALPFTSAATFARLIALDFPGLFQENLGLEPVLQELSSEFYARVLEALAVTPLPMCRQMIQDLVFRQIMVHLDPQQYGISINLVCCMIPRPGRKVRSLREVSGQGTLPWQYDLARKTMFLGAESLVGHMITQHRPLVINSRREITFFPANWTMYESSVAAFPILCQARVAGGLLVSSVQENFFNRERLALLEYYSHLIPLMFEPEEFYNPADIELGIMPSEDFQASYFGDFNQRVSQKFAEALLTENRITLQEARQFVWQDLEEELLRFFF